MTSAGSLGFLIEVFGFCRGGGTVEANGLFPFFNLENGCFYTVLFLLDDPFQGVVDGEHLFYDRLDIPGKRINGCLGVGSDRERSGLPLLLIRENLFFPLLYILKEFFGALEKIMGFFSGDMGEGSPELGREIEQIPVGLKLFLE